MSNPTEDLAVQLGVSGASLESLGVSRNDTAWHYPERDSDGQVIGTARRFDDGRKGSVAGGHRGLCLAWPLDPQAGATAGNPLLIVEGMSDTAAGIDLGFSAIGRPSATGGLEHLRPLVKARHVAIVGENDSGAGKTGAEKIARGLADVTASVRVIYPPAGVKDLREWKNGPAPCDRAEVLAACRAAAVVTPPVNPRAVGAVKPVKDIDRELVTTCAADVPRQPIRWLWPGRVPLGKLTIISGDPKLGKSLITIDLTARVSTGGVLPDDPGRRFAPAGVVIISAEDDPADTTCPRLDAAGADSKRVRLALMVKSIDPETGKEWERVFTLADVPELERAIMATPDCRLVIVDPVSAFLGGADSHKSAEVRGALAPLAHLAAKHGVAIVAIDHLNKAAGGPAMYRSNGSIAFVAAARSVLAVCKDKDDPTGRRRLLLSVGGNLAAEPAGLAYTVQATPGNVPYVAWSTDPVTLTADEALSLPDSKPGPEADAQDAAVDWLRQTLADGPRLAKELIEEWTHGQGGSKPTLDRARKTLNVTAYRQAIPGAWWWALQGYQDSPTPLEPDDLDNLAKKQAFAGGGNSKVIKLMEPENLGPGNAPTWPAGAPVTAPVDLPNDGEGSSDWPDREGGAA